MNYWELTIPIILKRDLHLKDMYEEMSKVINKVMLLDEKLKHFHKINTFKSYVYSGLYPAGKDGYRKGNMYSFRFRTLDRVLGLKVKNLIQKVDNDLFQVVTVGIESVDFRPIDKIYTVTPCISVITEDDCIRHWTSNDYSLDIIKERINSNTQRKYKLYFDEDIDKNHNLIKDIKQQNKVVISLNYKGGKLLTNKFLIEVNEDKLSQNLAFIMMATGILEKNSLGLGFCTKGR